MNSQSRDPGTTSGEELGRKRRSKFWTAVLLGAWLLYFISYGPVAARLHDHPKFWPPWLYTFYRPYHWVEEYTPLRGPLYAYENWCRAVLY
jgi:hypothetical protein